jgi:hydroxypyruvate reductase
MLSRMSTPNLPELRAEARRIFAAGVAAADPYAAVAGALPALNLRPDPGGRVVMIAVGKAAMRMAEAALSVLGPCLAVVVTNAENATDLPGANVIVAGHPVPDEGGARAAETVLSALGGLGPADRVLALISGGGSAMLPAPVAGVSLADKAEVNRLLLASGADIAEVNLVRQQLSRLKGGGLLRAAAPAKVTALVLSDVVGDDLRIIASGPTAAPLGTRATARALLDLRGLWDRVPASVRTHLSAPEPPAAPLPPGRNLLVGSNALSVAAMAAAGARAYPRPLTGDVGEAVHEVYAAAMGAGPGQPLAFGGETTVTLQGGGRGGRNQELALRFALLARDRRLQGPWVFLASGSDGRDGPTDAAGGIVDDTTLGKIESAGIDPDDAVAQNDSYTALKAADALVMTGGTGTNVADLSVFIRA